VYREDYVLPLKALSTRADPAAFVAAVTKAQRWSASFAWDQPTHQVRTALEARNAFREDLRNYKLVFPERTVPT
jgi:hypothetical protein